MKKYQQYLPYLIIVIFLSLPGLTEKTHISLAWIGIVILIIAIILLFEFFEKSRIKRIKKWSKDKPSKHLHMIRYSLYYALPISLIIGLLIYKQAQILYLVMFIVIPLILIFGWIGYLDWQKCQEEYLSKKY